MGTNESDLIVTAYVTKDYETCSKLAYLRPTLLLVNFTRVLRGTFKENSAFILRSCNVSTTTKEDMVLSFKGNVFEQRMKPMKPIN
ncbi:hypothetical protein [Hoylesella timonensis]|uniref:Uncharacterized protein n=1 Tax=Hoylesella timonensis TaxID=386414 RepID=A0A2N6Q7Q8_9BACT|nr:hypothetical protein [Hoylesella timonensis]PMC10967.1 hypothetical protein CJ232_02405 [Hoylesella timonensis]